MYIGRLTARASATVDAVPPVAQVRDNVIVRMPLTVGFAATCTVHDAPLARSDVPHVSLVISNSLGASPLFSGAAQPVAGPAPVFENVKVTGAELAARA